MRAAYAALLLGILGGVLLASSVLSGRTERGSTTVAGVLALDRPDVDLDRRRAEAVAVQVARCMTSRGFAWTPWVEPEPTIPDADLDPVAWAERWGFGVSTMVGLPEPPAPVDPTALAVADRPADLRDAHRAALDSAGGCRMDATRTVYGVRDRALAPLRSALAELNAWIAASAGAEIATDGWRRCVRPIADGRAPDRRTLTFELRDRSVRRIAALGMVSGLIAVQVDERRVASALAGCDTAYDRARAEAAAPFEAAFVTKHRASLEAIGAQIRAAEAALPSLPP